MRSSVRLAVCWLCCLALLASGYAPARAEASFTIDLDAIDMSALRDSAYLSANLSACAQGVRVLKRVSASSELAASVRLTIVEAETGELIFDKDYGYQSGTFDSGTVYLPYVDSRTIPYIITLYAGDWVYAVPFFCLQMRMERNGACLWGARMRELDPALDADWLMGTVLDLDALRAQGVMVLPICASNLYVLGQATVALQNDTLTVSLAFAPDADAEVHRCAVYCVTDPGQVTGASARGMDAPEYGVGQGIDVTGASTALLYVPMSVSYDSSGLGVFAYEPEADASLREQMARFARWRAQ